MIDLYPIGKQCFESGRLSGTTPVSPIAPFSFLQSSESSPNPPGGHGLDKAIWDHRNLILEHARHQRKLNRQPRTDYSLIAQPAFPVDAEPVHLAGPLAGLMPPGTRYNFFVTATYYRKARLRGETGSGAERANVWIEVQTTVGHVAPPCPEGGG